MKRLMILAMAFAMTFTGLTGLSIEAAEALPTIGCTLKVADPHRSTHNPASVNVVATTSCSAPVSPISTTINLYNYDTGARVATKSGNKSDTAKFRISAAAKCVPARYYGTASGTVYFPPGYPSPQSATANSRLVYVSCT